MDSSLLEPGAPNRSKQVEDARDMFDQIKRNAEKSNSAVPPYEFIELIGKGAFGRVYKCRHTETSQLVAVKILNIDDADFQADSRERDETIKDFRKEVEILTQLKDFKARNVNVIHDAFDLHSQLWIISDFCTGGSVRTLMRANAKRGLEEKYIIPIARELAVAIKSVHDIGVIHRDLKCANVYVTEDGRIQLGDFGVVGVMDNGVAKRNTIVGTPWYMPREMHVDTFSVTQGYGKEIDIWAYGITIYEMATGMVPNAQVPEGMLGAVLEQQTPCLDGEDHSGDIRDFVAFCLQRNPASRPTADQILKHPFIAGTRQTYPTNSLVALIDRYVVWEHRGGQRTSLFNPGGAAAPVRVSEETDEPATETDDWNFNTSDSFYGGFAKRYSQVVVSEDYDPQFEAPPGAGLPPVRAKNLTPMEMIQREHAAKSENRGAQSLERIWNTSAAPYDVDGHNPSFEPANDLPLREYSSGSAPRESTVFIDLDTTPSEPSGPAFNFDFENMPTVKAKHRGSVVEEQPEVQPTYNDTNDDKRSTMAWTFPTLAAEDTQVKRATMDWTWPGEPASAPLNTDAPVTLNGDSNDLPFRPQLKHTATAPLGQMGDFIHTGPAYDHNAPSRESLHSLIDLNLDSSDSGEEPRPSTAVSYTGSTSTIMTAGPFDLDDGKGTSNENRFSAHKTWASEGANGNRNSIRKIPLHQRGSSLSSTDSDEKSRHKRDFYNEDYLSDIRDERYFDTMSGPRSVRTAPFESDLTWDKEEEDEIEYSTAEIPAFGDFTFPQPSIVPEVPGMPRPPRARGSDGKRLEAVDFPMPRAPAAEALHDHVDDRLIMSELQRLLREAGQAFKSTSMALERYGELENKDRPRTNGSHNTSNTAATAQHKHGA